MTTTALILREPPSANRWWRNVNGRMVLSRAAREYKQHVANEAFVRRVRPIQKPEHVAVTITWYRQRRVGDLDKRVGILLDALIGHCYTDDSQVTSLFAQRVDAAERRGEVEVMVTRIKDS